MLCFWYILLALSLISSICKLKVQVLLPEVAVITTSVDYYNCATNNEPELIAIETIYVLFIWNKRG
jgi:hypothetical protein